MNIFTLRDDKYSPHLISAPSAMSAGSSEMMQAWCCALLCLVKRPLALRSMCEGVESVFVGSVFVRFGIILLEQQFFMGLSVSIKQMLKITPIIKLEMRSKEETKFTTQKNKTT